MDLFCGYHCANVTLGDENPSLKNFQRLCAWLTSLNLCSHCFGSQYQNWWGGYGISQGQKQAHLNSAVPFIKKPEYLFLMRLLFTRCQNEKVIMQNLENFMKAHVLVSRPVE